MTDKAKHFDAWVIILKCLDTFVMTAKAKVSEAMLGF